MTGGLLAGFVTSFVTAAVELSATMLLVAARARRAAVLRHLRLHAVAAGRGPGAALGVIAVVDRRDRHLPSHSLSIAAARTRPRIAERPDGHAPSASNRSTSTSRYGATAVLRGHQPRRSSPGEFFAFLGPSGSRQDHAAAPDRRLQPAPTAAAC